MLILEAICFFGFIATWAAAENIPLCAVLFAAAVGAGFLCLRQADKK